MKQTMQPVHALCKWLEFISLFSQTKMLDTELVISVQKMSNNIQDGLIFLK